MTASDELHALYKQWRRLTQSEGEAIRLGAWPQVEHFQQAKRQLQPRISEVAGRLDAVSEERQFGPIVEELIQLERQNSVLLQAQRQVAQHQQDLLNKTSRHLRQLHRSYVPAASAHWQSYS